MYDIVIIGGGPAGISAGIYAARKKLNTLLITKDFLGQIWKAVEVQNYPGFEQITGVELIGKFKKQLDSFAIDVNEGEEVKAINKKENHFEVITTEKDRYSTKTIIITSGRDSRPLEVIGEKEFIGKGVSYCVTCDGPIFTGKNVAVVGGGNSGFMAAIELAKYCPKVYLLEAGIKLRADEVYQEMARLAKNIEVMVKIKVKEIKGDNFVSSLVYEDQVTKKENNLLVQGIFVEIGSLPATGFVKDLVDFNAKDEIKIDPKNCATKTPGIFAAGDVTDVRDKQVVIACGEGVKASLSAYYYLQEITVKKN
ncbi:MAG: FAD-dependent oxidoreductase [bacterium]